MHDEFIAIIKFLKDEGVPTSHFTNPNFLCKLSINEEIVDFLLDLGAPITCFFNKMTEPFNCHQIEKVLSKHAKSVEKRVNYLLELLSICVIEKRTDMARGILGDKYFPADLSQYPMKACDIIAQAVAYQPVLFDSEIGVDDNTEAYRKMLLKGIFRSQRNSLQKNADMDFLDFLIREMHSRNAPLYCKELDI